MGWKWRSGDGGTECPDKQRKRPDILGCTKRKNGKSEGRGRKAGNVARSWVRDTNLKAGDEK